MIANKNSLWMGGGSAACVALAAAGWFLLVSPARASVSSTDAATTQVETQNATLQTHLDQLQAQAKQLSTKESQLAAVAARIPVTGSQQDLLRELTSLERKTHVTMSTLTPGAAAAASATAAPAAAAAGSSPAQKVGVSLTVGGSYAQLEDYLTGLETLKRLVVVNSVSFTKGAGTGGQQLLTATITGTAFTTTADVVTPSLPASAASGVTASPAAAS